MARLVFQYVNYSLYSKGLKDKERTLSKSTARRVIANSMVKDVVNPLLRVDGGITETINKEKEFVRRYKR